MAENKDLWGQYLASKYKIPPGMPLPSPATKEPIVVRESAPQQPTKADNNYLWKVSYDPDIQKTVIMGGDLLKQRPIQQKSALETLKSKVPYDYTAKGQIEGRMRYIGQQIPTSLQTTLARQKLFLNKKAQEQRINQINAEIDLQRQGRLREPSREEYRYKRAKYDPGTYFFSTLVDPIRPFYGVYTSGGSLKKYREQTLEDRINYLKWVESSGSATEALKWHAPAIAMSTMFPAAIAQPTKTIIPYVINFGGKAIYAGMTGLQLGQTNVS